MHHSCHDKFDSPSRQWRFGIILGYSKNKYNMHKNLLDILFYLCLSLTRLQCNKLPLYSASRDPFLETNVQ